MKTESTAVRLSDYRPPDFAVDAVDLDFILDPTQTKVTARLKLARKNPAATSLELMGDELALLEVRLDGTPLSTARYAATPTSLTIKDVPAKPFELTIVTEINPSANTKLMGLYRSTKTFCTQCEAEGFRRITYYLDRPDVLSVFTTRLEADKATSPVLLSNGNLIKTGDLPNGRHFAVWHDPFPKPAYLFAMVAGDLGALSDSFVTASGKKVALNIYCEHGKEPRTAYAMDSLKRSMRWDEEAFGREYDLGIFNVVAVSDFNMGAMENKGLNVFNDKYVLVDPDTATDVDFANVEAVIAHEYFHNWTGNRITCRDWFQLCLKEGLTVFRDQEFSSDMRCRPVKRISDVRTLQARQFPEDAGPLAHPVRPEMYSEINNFYTATVYEKGAEVIRMLKALLGADKFRAGMDVYFERHDGQAVTIEDFLACFADAAKIDLSQFKLWYSQAGTPEVMAKGTYDAARRTYALTLRQSVPPTPEQPVKKPMHIPVRFGLVGRNGEDIAYDKAEGGNIAGDIIHLTQAEQTVTFHGVAARPIPSLLRGFSAPVRLMMDTPPADLLFLLRTDADQFNRWQAAQTLAMRSLIAGTTAARKGERADIDDTLIDAIADVAEDERLEAAFRAQVLHLPSEADVARDIGREVDPDAIHAARKAIRARIADRVGGRLGQVVERMHDGRPFVPDSTSAGRRALANAALDLMVANGNRAAVQTVVDRFDRADNMTDRSAALSILAGNALEPRGRALQAFYERYHDDPLVLDKWLMLEAIVPAHDTLDRVRTLLDHPLLTSGNPNRIRALIGSFASGNQKEFNRADGAGYDFVTDFIVDLDRRNPQTAARLLVAFRSWRALETSRRAHAERALRRVAGTESLSPDTRDIITRTLA